MDFATQFQRVRQIAEQRFWRKTLRRWAWVTLGPAIATLYQGALGLAVHPANGVFLVTGVLLMLVSLSNLTRPHPQGVVLDGCVLGLGFAVHLLFLLLAIPAGIPGFEFHSFMLGLAEGGWAIHRFRSYRGYANAVEAVAATPQDFEALDELADRIRDGDLKKDGDLLAFMLRRHGTQKWRAMLLGEIAIILECQGPGLFFLTAEEFHIKVKGRELLSRNLYGFVRLGGEKRWYATLAPESYGKYERWKAESAMTVLPASKPAR